MQRRLGLYLSDLTPLFNAAAAADSTLTLATPQGAMAVDRLGDVQSSGGTAVQLVQQYSRYSSTAAVHQHC